MKILYGVQGTGNGHIARARVMAKAFSARADVAVDFLFSGRAPEQYFDMQVFGDYQTRDGLTFITAKGAVSRWQTVKQAKLRRFIKDVRGLDLSSYDLVLNDFEPVSAWAAKKQNVPAISISHQAAFAFPVPKKGDNFIDRAITRYFAPAQIKLGVHWFHFGNAIMPPFIDEPVVEAPRNSHILVYLPFEELEDIHALLAPFTEYQFECFHPKLRKNYRDGHINWHQTSKPKFQDSLVHCSGVIANGGFELSSECLQLGKKLLIKPLKGQFEQLSNVLTLSQLGLCHTMSKLNDRSVSEWLDSPAIQPIQFPNDPQILIDWLLTKDWHNTASICDQLWQQVVFPDAVKQKLEKIASTN